MAKLHVAKLHVAKLHVAKLSTQPQSPNPVRAVLVRIELACHGFLEREGKPVERQDTRGRSSAHESLKLIVRQAVLT